MMLALSVKQPWADVLVSGYKTIEVRTWWPRLQLPVLVAIHAGKTVARDAPRAIWAEAFKLSATDQHSRLGGIIGVASFIGLHDFGANGHYTDPARGYAHFLETADRHRVPLEWWHEDMTGFEFAQPVRFGEIIPCRGKLGFYRLSPEVEAQVREAMR